MTKHKVIRCEAVGIAHELAVAEAEGFQLKFIERETGSPHCSSFVLVMVKDD